MGRPITYFIWIELTHIKGKRNLKTSLWQKGLMD
jgi:hypothetical protein